MNVFLKIKSLFNSLLEIPKNWIPEGWEDENGFHYGKEPYKKIPACEIAEQMAESVNKLKEQGSLHQLFKE